MLFETSITIPAKNNGNGTAEETLRIAHGVITKIMVRPRPGHKGVAHCIILHHEHQIAPSITGMDISGDFFPIDWEEFYECYQPPYELKIQGWNESENHPHTFDVFVAVLPRKAILPYAIADALRGLIGMLAPRRIFTRSD